MASDNGIPTIDPANAQRVRRRGRPANADDTLLQTTVGCMSETANLRVHEALQAASAMTASMHDMLIAEGSYRASPELTARCMALSQGAAFLIDLARDRLLNPIERGAKEVA